MGGDLRDIKPKKSEEKRRNEGRKGRSCGVISMNELWCCFLSCSSFHRSRRKGKRVSIVCLLQASQVKYAFTNEESQLALAGEGQTTTSNDEESEQQQQQQRDAIAIAIVYIRNQLLGVFIAVIFLFQLFLSTVSAAGFLTRSRALVIFLL